MRVLVVNAGSSSLKLRLVDDADTVVGRADLGRPADQLIEVRQAVRVVVEARRDQPGEQGDDECGVGNVSNAECGMRSAE